MISLNVLACTQPESTPMKLTVSQADRATSDIVKAPGAPAIAQFTELWRSRCQGNTLPGRGDFDWSDLRPWFGSILMMDVIDGGADFRYRLIGVKLIEAVHRDLTGKMVSECSYGDNRDNVVDTFRRPVIERAPVFRKGPVVWRPDFDWRHYASVHCPLASDGKTVDMTIGVQVYF